jgi:hypothetical protein
MKGLRPGVQQSEPMSDMMIMAAGYAENGRPSLATPSYYHHHAGHAAPAQSTVSPEIPVMSLKAQQSRPVDSRNSFRGAATARRHDAVMTI